MRNMLGFLNQNLYHDYLNITNIMKLKRLDFRDVYGLRSPDLILTRENLMERVMLLITSYFCMGTELRFLKQMMVEGFEDSIDSEFWHGKALELAIKFLPGDAPLVKHIVSSYQKHHSPSFEQIPEDEEVQSEVKVIRPNEGITYNKISPVIRDIPKPSVKLAPLDLPLNNYYNKQKEIEPKSTANISECLKDSKLYGNKRGENDDSSKSKLIQNTSESSQILTKSDKKNKSTDRLSKDKNKNLVKISTEETITHSKFLCSLENSDSLNNKEVKDGNKGFAVFKNTGTSKQSKTIDSAEVKKASNTTSSVRSISPTANAVKTRIGTILRTRTEENTLNSIHDNSGGNSNTRIGSRGRQNKSSSNERSKSKKKSSSKEKIHQRPKTSKSYRKDKNNPNLTSKLFKNFYKKNEDKKITQLNTNINSLLSSHSTSVNFGFPGGFLDRPSSVMEDIKQSKMSKIHEHKDKSRKLKGNKSTRGGTPAPAALGRQKQVNTSLGLRSSGSQFIERSISNE